MNPGWTGFTVGIIIGFILGTVSLWLCLSKKCKQCSADLKRILRIRPETIDEREAEKWEPPI